MKKTVVFSLVFFVAGIGLAGVVLINPINWNWASALRERLTPTAMSDEMNLSAGETRERTILHWVAPMDPAFTSDEPGKSPMGMDLIPVYEDEVAERTIAYWVAPMGEPDNMSARYGPDVTARWRSPCPVPCLSL